MAKATQRSKLLVLDRIDRRILTLMQDDARITNLELADKVGLSPTPCSRRVKRLEESGLITRPRHAAQPVAARAQHHCDD